jgi:hypothetical protein
VVFFGHSSTNKTDSHDLTAVLLKAELNTITYLVLNVEIDMLIKKII